MFFLVASLRKSDYAAPQNLYCPCVVVKRPRANYTEDQHRRSTLGPWHSQRASPRAQLVPAPSPRCASRAPSRAPRAAAWTSPAREARLHARALNVCRALARVFRVLPAGSRLLRETPQNQNIRHVVTTWRREGRKTDHPCHWTSFQRKCQLPICFPRAPLLKLVRPELRLCQVLGELAVGRAARHARLQLPDLLPVRL